VPARSWRRLRWPWRIDGPIPAYLACCAIATFTVAAVDALLIVGGAVAIEEWQGFNFVAFVFFGLRMLLLLTILGSILALPFVPLATLIGARFRIESAAYYILSGMACMTPLAYLAIGVPTAGDREAWHSWAIALSCPGMFGAAWWYLHRRWRQNRRPMSDIFG
jgi:hypothetical protein